MALYAHSMRRLANLASAVVSPSAVAAGKSVTKVGLIGYGLIG